MRTLLLIIQSYFNKSNWFTYFFNREKRYIVALTNNNNWFRLFRIIKQLRAIRFKDKTIWWWTSPDWERFVDVWVTTNSLKKAIKLAKKYNQQAIFDMQELNEIFI